MDGENLNKKEERNTNSPVNMLTASNFATVSSAIFAANSTALNFLNFNNNKIY